MLKYGCVFAALFVFVGCGDDSAGGDNQNNQNNSRCGNGGLDQGEECDDGVNNSDTEPDACRTDCRQAHCGDEVADSNEECDGQDLKYRICEDFPGLTGGRLLCNQDCTYNVTQCAGCGNGSMETGEECDGADLGGASCVDINHQHGIVVCGSGCTLDYSGCHTCGNGTIEGVESCDGTEVGGEDCLSQVGLESGAIACENDCLGFDTSDCHTCGNGTIEGPEECDSANLGGNNCSLVTGHVQGVLACSGGCSFDTTGCYTCGDGSIDGPEVCDGNNVNGESCDSLTSYPHGELACAADCRSIVTSGCHNCGNGTIEGPEQCDGTNLGGDCTTAGHNGGTLACASDCQWDEDECFDCENPDVTEPVASNHVPAPETPGAPANTMIQVDLFDTCGIAAGITMQLTITPLSGPVDVIDPTPVVTGSGYNVTVSYDHPGNFPVGSIVEVMVSADDVNSNTLVENWRFSVAHQMSLFCGNDACVIDESQPSANLHPAQESWPVGGGSGNDQRYIMLFAPNVPVGSTIFGATLNLGVCQPGATTAATLECYRLNAESDGSEATWTDRLTTPANIPWTVPGSNGVPDDRQGSPAASIAIAASTPPYTAINGDVTGLVSEWAAGADQFGIICTNGGDNIVPICSPYSNYPPHIDLTYGPPLP